MKINSVMLKLGQSFPHGFYVHDTGENTVEVRRIFPGGALRATAQATGAWVIVVESFARPPVPEETVATGSDVAALAPDFMRRLEALENGVPVVGGGASYTPATDSHACTIERVDMRDGKPWRVTLRRDKAKLLNGAGSGEPDALTFTPGGFVGHTSGVQRWEYEPNLDGTRYVVTRRALKGGIVRWKVVGVSAHSPGCSATFLGRHEHYDHNF